MATEMDIDMDLDIGLPEENLTIAEVAVVSDIALSSDNQEPKPILDAPNDTSDPNALEPVPQKVHVRGLDNLTTHDIRAFSGQYYDLHKPSHVEWIDDTSANLVYETPEIAREALISFITAEARDLTAASTLQMMPAKPFPLHPQTYLEVRLAVLGDRKQAGARARSRFYLFNPEYDPAERRKQAGYRGGKKYRDREEGGYRSQRYDDREQQKREREAEFDASLYDDDEVTIAQRAARTGKHRDSSSEKESKSRRAARFQKPAGKELFPDRTDRASGRLRDRSASPLHDSDGDPDPEISASARRKAGSTAASANRLKAQIIKSTFRDTSSTKELFPQKTNIIHRRSDAFDAADETADLFANKMPVPFTDGSRDSGPGNRASLASRITGKAAEDGSSRFSIRGAAKTPTTSTQSFTIKGAAGVKELFPSTFGDNSGKELFSERIEGRGRRRQRAEDLFH